MSAADFVNRHDQPTPKPLGNWFGLSGPGPKNGKIDGSETGLSFSRPDKNAPFVRELSAKVGADYDSALASMSEGALHLYVFNKYPEVFQKWGANVQGKPTGTLDLGPLVRFASQKKLLGFVETLSKTVEARDIPVFAQLHNVLVGAVEDYALFPDAVNRLLKDGGAPTQPTMNRVGSFATSELRAAQSDTSRALPLALRLNEAQLEDAAAVFFDAATLIQTQSRRGGLVLPWVEKSADHAEKKLARVFETPIQGSSALANVAKFPFQVARLVGVRLQQLGLLLMAFLGGVVDSIYGAATGDGAVGESYLRKDGFAKLAALKDASSPLGQAVIAEMVAFNITSSETERPFLKAFAPGTEAEQSALIALSSQAEPLRQKARALVESCYDAKAGQYRRTDHIGWPHISAEQSLAVAKTRYL